MKHATYLGRGTLYGKTALVRPSVVEGFVMAQFDDAATGFGYGWTVFPAAEFLLDPDQ